GFFAYEPLDHARTPAVERVSCRAPAFGVRQLAGAFARGTAGSGAAWLALVDKSGDKSPQSKRCRAGETTGRMPVPRVRCALHAYGAGVPDSKGSTPALPPRGGESAPF